MEEIVDLSFFEDSENDSFSPHGYFSRFSSRIFDVRQESNFVGLLNQGATVCS